MASRRSRIKAVANLPARRNRQPTNADIKREEADSTEDITEDLIGSSHHLQNNIVKEKSQKHGLSKSLQGSSTEGLAKQPAKTSDRKSVIVSFDKDRKSVIVNRNSDQSGTSTCKDVDRESKENVCQGISEDTSTVKSNLKGRGVRMVDKPHECPTILDEQPDKVNERQCKTEKSSFSAGSSNASEECSDHRADLDLPTTHNSPSKGTSSSNALQPTFEGNSETFVSPNIRGPFRGRRSKPVVNLTAASRKRPATDIPSPLPSSPIQKIRSPDVICPSGNESDHDNEVSEPSVSGEKIDVNVAKETLPKVPCTSKLSSSPATSVNHTSDPFISISGGTSGSSTSGKDSQSGIGSGGDSANTVGSTPLTASKEFNSVSKRKQSTSAIKAATARKNFKSRFSADQPPPRSALTMFDLIFYNPSKNPMKSSGQPSSVKSRSRQTSVSSVHEERLREESVDDVEEDRNTNRNEEETEEPAMPVPRVKVGPDGSLILDEQSLVIETTGAKKIREELEKSEVIIDTGSSYGLYKRTKRSKDWSDDETKKFYRALNVVGTDFSLMKPLFRNRTRRELKLKFKKEERLNSSLVNKALNEHLDFDVTELEKECELEEEAEKRQETSTKGKHSRGLESNLRVEKVNQPKKKSSKPRVKRSRLSVEIENVSQEEVDGVKGDANVVKPSTPDNIAIPSTTVANWQRKPPKKKFKPTQADEDFQNLSKGVDKGFPQECLSTRSQIKNRTKSVKVKSSVVRRSEEMPERSSSQHNKNSTVMKAAETEQSKEDSTCRDGSEQEQNSSQISRKESNLVHSEEICPKLVDKPAPSGSVSSPNPSSSRAVVTPIGKTVYRIVNNVCTPPSHLHMSTPPHAPQNSPLPPVGSPITRLFSPANLPRMEPGSLVVLKTPIPENPERHILQVYMVTNKPPSSDGSVSQVLHTPAIPGITALPPPIATPARSSSMSSDSESEKVLTKL